MTDARGSAPDTVARVELAEAVAGTWNANHLAYSVVHGLHPDGSDLGRDLDIAIHRRDVPAAVKLARSCAELHGFSEVAFRWSQWGLYQMALISREREVALPIDLLCTLDVWRAKFVSLINDADLNRIVEGDDFRGPLRVSTEGEFIKACVRPLLCGDLSRFGTEFAVPVEIPQSSSRALLKRALGAYGLSLILERRNESELRKAFPAAVWRLQLGWLARHPLRFPTSAARIASGRVRRRLKNPGDALVVPAGAGLNEASFRACAARLLPMFVKLRFGDTVSSSAGLRREVIKSRVGPVSEFVLTVIPANDHLFAAARRNQVNPRAWTRGVRALSAPDGFLDIARSDVLEDALVHGVLTHVVSRYASPW